MASPNPIEPRPISGDGGAAPSSSREWPDLSVDILSCIFSRLSSLDLLLAVSAVCSLWRAAARHPRFRRRRILDLSDWDSFSAKSPVYVPFDRVVNRVLGFVIEWEFIEEVYFPLVAREQDLLLVSERLPNLLYFSFPTCKEPESTFYSALTNFKSLKGIAVHIVTFQTTNFLSEIILHFPNLSELKLFCEVPCSCYYLKQICMFLKRLRKLEMPKPCRITEKEIVMILDSLKYLEYLDISGSKRQLDKGVIEEKSSRFKDVYFVFPDWMT
ncbi:hypothetical protein LUZ60_000725 [Juncus effusus]|nr:hypothetical protein LUZ60_000725 [Juncus effusus]